MNLKSRKLFTLSLLLLALLTMDATDVQAQRRHRRHHRRGQVFRAYPILGATASQMRGDELRGFKRWGFTAGVGSIMALSDDDMWHISLEADFAQRGAYNKTNDPYALLEFQLNYVDIPVAVHFTDPYGGITLGVGLNYSRLVQQPHGEMVFSPTYFVPDTSDMSFLKNDLAAVIDLRFPVWRGLTLNFRYQHSIIPVKRDWYFTEYNTALPGGSDTWCNDIYNSSVSVRLLYVFGESDSRKPHRKKHRR